MMLLRRASGIAALFLVAWAATAYAECVGGVVPSMGPRLLVTELRERYCSLASGIEVFPT